MIRLQIIERDGVDLLRQLLDAMREGELKTFSPERRGRKVTHVNAPGWMNWRRSHGVITCEILSPNKPGGEWYFLRAFIGRLADRYAGSIASVHVQFPSPPVARRKRTRQKRR